MTIQEWRDNPSLAVDLDKILNMPIMKMAMEICDSLTAAKTIGSSSSLISNANNAHVLFGFDSGRASVLRDLRELSITPEAPKEIEPSYVGEF